jgi:hypothetical protein
MKSFEQKLAKHAKAAAAEYAASAGFILIRNPGIFAGGVDISLLRGLRELLFNNSFLLQILTTTRLIQVVGKMLMAYSLYRFSLGVPMVRQ